MNESSREGLTAIKVLAFIGILLMISDAVLYFYSAAIDPLFILYGIVEIILALILFFSLELVEILPFKIPFEWWLLLVFGVIVIIFGYLGLTMSYFTGTIVTIAAIIALLGQKKEYQASKIVALLGAAFGIYDSVILILALGDPINGVLLTNSIFGLILAIILILTLQTKIDIKVPFAWWVVVTVGFVFFTWISASAAIAAALMAFVPAIGIALPVAGWAGQLILIAFVLLAFDF